MQKLLPGPKWADAPTENTPHDQGKDYQNQQEEQVADKEIP